MCIRDRAPGDVVVVKGSPGAIAPAVAGYFREGGGVQAAAVGHLHCVHHPLPGLEGDAEGEKVRRNALQGGDCLLYTS